VHEADHSHPTSAEVKKMRIYTCTPPNPFMASCLVNHKDNFTIFSWGEMEFGETVYHTNVRQFCCTSVLNLPFYDMILFVEKEEE
jgi:hypothetical protein